MQLAALLRRHLPTALGRSADAVAVTAYRALRFAPWLQRFALRRTHTLFLVGVLGLVRSPDGRLLFFHHTYRPPHGWGLPGGWMARGERPAEALVREVGEESGLRIRPLGLQCVLFEDGGPWVEVVLHAELEGGTFSPSPEVDGMLLAGPGEIPPGLRPGHRRLAEELLAAPPLS